MTDHKAAKEYAQTVSSKRTWMVQPKVENLAACYLDLTAQIAEKDAVIGELLKTLEFIGYTKELDGMQPAMAISILLGNARQAVIKHRESADKGE